MIDLEQFQKYIKRKEIIKQKLTYMDIQVLWCLLDTLWRTKILSSTIYYDLDEEFKWETNDRTWMDHGDYDMRHNDYWDYEYSEEDIFPQPKDKGKVKGQKMAGKPAYARPGTVKGNKKR